MTSGLWARSGRAPEIGANRPSAPREGTPDLRLFGASVNRLRRLAGFFRRVAPSRRRSADQRAVCNVLARLAQRHSLGPAAAPDASAGGTALIALILGRVVAGFPIFPTPHRLTLYGFSSVRTRISRSDLSMKPVVFIVCLSLSAKQQFERVACPRNQNIQKHTESPTLQGVFALSIFLESLGQAGARCALNEYDPGHKTPEACGVANLSKAVKSRRSTAARIAFAQSAWSGSDASSA